MSRYPRLHRLLDRLERRLTPLLAPGKSPDAWFEDLSDEGFLEIIVPYCHLEATIYNPGEVVDADYLPAYRQLAVQVITAAEAGRCHEARRHFRLLEQLRRHQRHPHWRTLLPAPQPSSPATPAPPA